MRRQMTSTNDPAENRVPPPASYKILYDGQCEICQAGVSWLRVLDNLQRCDCVPISPEALAGCHTKLELEACLRELHVLAPDGHLYVGWDAVAALARLFPPTRLIGIAGSVAPFKQLGRVAYGFVARNRYSLSKCRGGACKVSRPGEVRKRASFGAFWSCYSLGLFARLPLVFWFAIRGMAQRISAF